MRILTLLISILFGMEAFGQTLMLSDFDETEPPKVSFAGAEWSRLNQSDFECEVSLNGDRLVLTKRIPKGQNTELSVRDGKLVGHNNGEWGGWLEFVPNSSPQEPVKIMGGNIQSIFRFNNDIYVMEGLAHMSISRGALYRLYSRGDSYGGTKVIDFEDAPAVLEIRNDTILIASSGGFFTVHNFKKEFIFKDTFWSGLYPNSMAVKDSRNIYVGIRSGYVKLDLIKKEYKFFRYKNFESDKDRISAMNWGSTNQIRLVDRLSDTLIKNHQYDDFYLYFRSLPYQSADIIDFVMKRSGDQWSASRADQPDIRRKNAVTLRQAELMELIEKIDIDKLSQVPLSDSLIGKNAEFILGSSNNYFLICSKGRVRIIEYPYLLHYNKSVDLTMQSIYWHSDYLDRVIELLRNTSKIKEEYFQNYKYIPDKCLLAP